MISTSGHDLLQGSTLPHVREETCHGDIPECGQSPSCTVKRFEATTCLYLLAAPCRI